MGNEPQPKLRLDKWLWYARVVKTRSLAAKVVQGGHVRVNRDKASAASHQIKVGDVLTVALHNQVKILKIIKLGDRRGPAPEAQMLYEDLSPPIERKPSREQWQAPSPNRRPSKRERRDIRNFKGDLQ